jgi:transcriptional regulator with XRE-family HTH domain
MVAEKIRSFLAKKGISQAELARQMGITPSALSQKLQGNPTMESLEKIAHALDVPVHDLFPSDNLVPVSRPTAADVVAMIESCPDPEAAILFCIDILKREKLYQQRVTCRKRGRGPDDTKG